MSAKITLEYRGRRYVVVDELSSDAQAADYFWTTGSFSCDDNRSMQIADQCDPDFPIMDCGDTISLISIEDGE